MLKDLPESLDETYEQTLLGIDKEKREFTQRLFKCLSVSIRPLRIEELAETFAVRFNPMLPPTFNEHFRPPDAEEAILSACSSLVAVVIRGDSQIVQFSHFSVKEYLTSERLSSLVPKPYTSSESSTYLYRCMRYRRARDERTSLFSSLSCTLYSTNCYRILASDGLSEYLLATWPNTCVPSSGKTLSANYSIIGLIRSD